MTRRRSFRSQLYRSARALGTLDAASRGPVPLGKRLVRKRIYRATNTGLGRALRRIGL